MIHLFICWSVGSKARQIGAWSMVVAMALLLLTTPGCSQDTSTTEAGGLFREASLVRQGESLYANAALKPRILSEWLTILQQGEPIQVSYWFDLHAQDSWFPNLGASGTTLKRRVRLNLITQRYELQDVLTKGTTFTSEEDEVLRFLGGPRLIPLVPLADINSRTTYQLRIRFRMEQEGLTGSLRLLQSVFSLRQPMEAVYLLNEQHP